MKKIGDVIDLVLAKSGLLEAVRRHEVVLKWPEVVGSELAQMTQAVAFNGTTLIVRVKDAALRNELSMKQLELVNRFHKLGYRTVKSIKFVR